ncbi:hypothetical protein Leryth_002584 [Lithospermum erythrorhizon]|nr:hypothetical protein Leryth_002584 [Lithospermum erythrorhizon]
MDCKVCSMTWDMRLRMSGLGGAAGSLGSGGGGGGFSHESEHDLALMVSDFLENGSSGPKSRYSSDSDSGLSDIAHLADKILYLKRSMDKYHRDLLSAVNSLLLSMKEMDLHFVKPGSCNASCIRYFLIKRLRISGYDAGVCVSNWPANGKVPGGDHEYIDVVNHGDNGSSERIIIDIDFPSHFEIARAVESYESILRSLPLIYVGSLSKLKHSLQVMVEAARSSLKQNSMPLPPWRSLAYLLAKWQSPYSRKLFPDDSHSSAGLSSDHTLCSEQLKRLQLSLQA